MPRTGRTLPTYTHTPIHGHRHALHSPSPSSTICRLFCTPLFLRTRSLNLAVFIPSPHEAEGLPPKAPLRPLMPTTIRLPSLPYPRLIAIYRTLPYASLHAPRTAFLSFSVWLAVCFSLFVCIAVCCLAVGASARTWTFLIYSLARLLDTLDSLALFVWYGMARTRGPLLFILFEYLHTLHTCILYHTRAVCARSPSMRHIWNFGSMLSLPTFPCAAPKSHTLDKIRPIYTYARPFNVLAVVLVMSSSCFSEQEGWYGCEVDLFMGNPEGVSPERAVVNGWSTVWRSSYPFGKIEIEDSETGCCSCLRFAKNS